MNLEQGFNPTNLKETRVYLEKKFKEILEETGIKLSMGTFTYEKDGSEFRTTLTAKTNVGNREEEAKKEWDKYCRDFGLQPAWFGQEFSHNGVDYVICGIKKYADTKPVVVHLKNNKDKKYVFPHMTLIPKFLTQTDKFTL